MNKTDFIVTLAIAAASSTSLAVDTAPKKDRAPSAVELPAFCSSVILNIVAAADDMLDDETRKGISITDVKLKSSKQIAKDGESGTRDTYEVSAGSVAHEGTFKVTASRGNCFINKVSLKQVPLKK